MTSRLLNLAANEEGNCVAELLVLTKLSLVRNRHRQQAFDRALGLFPLRPPQFGEAAIAAHAGSHERSADGNLDFIIPFRFQYAAPVPS